MTMSKKLLGLLLAGLLVGSLASLGSAQPPGDGGGRGGYGGRGGATGETSAGSPSSVTRRSRQLGRRPGVWSGRRRAVDCEECCTIRRTVWGLSAGEDASVEAGKQGESKSKESARQRPVTSPSRTGD